MADVAHTNVPPANKAEAFNVANAGRVHADLSNVLLVRPILSDDRKWSKLFPARDVKKKTILCSSEHISTCVTDHSRVMCTDGGTVPKGNSGRPMSKDEFMQLNSRMDVEVRSSLTLDRFACMSCRRYHVRSHWLDGFLVCLFYRGLPSLFFSLLLLGMSIILLFECAALSALQTSYILVFGPECIPCGRRICWGSCIMSRMLRLFSLT